MFGSRNSIQLGRIFGIRIGAGPSWFLVLGLMIYFLAGYFSDVLADESDTVTFAVAVAGAALFFISLILHELGHALAARRAGIGTTGIDLWLFGGLAKLDRDSRTPGEEFKIAAAGPAVTLAIMALCLVATALMNRTGDFMDAALLGADRTTPVLALTAWLGLINGALLVFNLIPAFPLDGGRIARAAAWKITGDKTRGTRISGRMGVGFSWLLAAVGIAIALTYDPFNGIWLCLLAWFINQGARAAVVSSEFSARIGAVIAADIMDSDPVTIPSGATALQATDDYFARYRTNWLPVVDGGIFKGILEAVRASGAVTAGQPALSVAELIDPNADELQIDAQTPLEELIGSPALVHAGALAVVDAEKRLLGVVTTDHVRRALTASSLGR
ncbi:MAG TPA: site-2 protease family protein [Baekduia sp.]|nr:site-2 protease family protein [Baekduia sp.]